MVLAQMVVDSVVLEGRSIRDTAQRYGVSKSWVHELVRPLPDFADSSAAGIKPVTVTSGGPTGPSER